MAEQSQPTTEINDEQAPILGSWNRLYILVVVLHFIIIALFSWLTLAYS